MEREIKFRGLRTDNKEWIYGGFVASINNSFNHEIIFREEYKGVIVFKNLYVFDETVGQFTGLKDKNGVEIYEGDRCIRNGHERTIIFHLGSFLAVPTKDWRQEVDIDHLTAIHNGWHLSNFISEIEVIGNIHEK